MKVLYVASNPTDGADLSLDREITELQRRFAAVSANPVHFIFLPEIKVEDLPAELGRHKPDILHVAAHADVESLSLADHAGNRVLVTAEVLRVFLSIERPPRLVYLNACNSDSIARELVDCGAVPIAIGSSAPITNRVARAAAVAFYERILGGSTVARAFEACEQMLKVLSSSGASVVLHQGPSAAPDREVLHATPQLVADFLDGKATPSRDHHYTFRLGVVGCPRDTTQVIFFTDDASYISEEETLEDDLCLVVRERSVNGVVWTPQDSNWRAAGDHRLTAVGVTAGGGTFVVDGTLCEAIHQFYLSRRAMVPKSVSSALQVLQENNGADLDPAVWDTERERTKRARSKRR